MKKLIAVAALAAVTAFVSMPAQARHGADDPRGDDRGGERHRHNDDGAGHTHLEQDKPFIVARHGADDRKGDDRGGERHRRNDDGAGHA